MPYQLKVFIGALVGSIVISCLLIIIGQQHLGFVFGMTSQLFTVGGMLLYIALFDPMRKYPNDSVGQRFIKACTFQRK